MARLFIEENISISEVIWTCYESTGLIGGRYYYCSESNLRVIEHANGLIHKYILTHNSAYRVDYFLDYWNETWDKRL